MTSEFDLPSGIVSALMVEARKEQPNMQTIQAGLDLLQDYFMALHSWSHDLAMNKVKMDERMSTEVCGIYPLAASDHWMSFYPKLSRMLERIRESIGQ